MPPTSTDAGVAPPATGGTEPTPLDRELAGLDALELADRAPRAERLQRIRAATWPKLAAIALALGLWQLVVWSGWKPAYVLPGPVPVFEQLWSSLVDGTLVTATALTMQRALVGFAISLVIGVLIGAVVSRSRVLRSAVGSLITGLQTMPSIAWFPLAILLFKLSEQAILFVIVVGAAPAIANGLIAGADNVPPLLVRAGRVLGARRVSLYRNVILPGSMPSFVAGTKQGWAFAWRSLMAGELLVIIANKPSIGTQLQVAREFSDAEMLLATMIVILVIGILVDAVVFGRLERMIRTRWGLIDAAA
jgi:NitT/TauT family transport system permease protein